MTITYAMISPVAHPGSPLGDCETPGGAGGDGGGDGGGAGGGGAGKSSWNCGAAWQSGCAHCAVSP